MIILHSHKAIFIRCRKTASTSIEIELSRYAKLGDIITGISPRDEHLRLKVGGSIPDQSSLEHSERYYNHMSAKEIKNLVSVDIWDSYFKFCFERNPWDKVISMFDHRFQRRTNAKNLEEFIDSGEFLDARNFDLYTENNKLLVDFVGKYESLNKDLDYIFNEVGISFTGLSSNAKSQFRQNPSYKSSYSKNTRLEVYKAFSDEILMHDYTY